VLLGERVLCDYAGFARRAAQLGHGLRHALGLQPGGRVAIPWPSGWSSARRRRAAVATA
jgi:hypothetical protein